MSVSAKVGSFEGFYSRIKDSPVLGIQYEETCRAYGILDGPPRRFSNLFEAFLGPLPLLPVLAVLQWGTTAYFEKDIK